MTIAVAQAWKGSRSTAGSSYTTGSVTVSQGSMIFVALIEASSGQSVTDSQSGTYTQIDVERTGHFGRQCTLWVRENVNSDAAFTITGSVSGANCLFTILALEITGYASSAYDVSASADDFSSPYNSGTTATSAQANNLLVGVAAAEDNTGASTVTVDGSSTPTAGWTNQTEETDGTQFLLGGLFTQRVTSVGTYNFAYTLSSSAGDHGDSFCVVLKEGGPAPYIPPRPDWRLQGPILAQ